LEHWTRFRQKKWQPIEKKGDSFPGRSSSPQWDPHPTPHFYEVAIAHEKWKDGFPKIWGRFVPEEGRRKAERRIKMKARARLIEMAVAAAICIGIGLFVPRIAGSHCDTLQGRW
jgi:hypothetical protein